MYVGQWYLSPLQSGTLGPRIHLCWLQHVHVQHCQVFCLLQPSRAWVTFKRFSTTFEAFVPHFYLCCTHRIIHKSLLNHLNSFTEECSSLTWNLKQTRCSAPSVILNVMAKQCICSLNGAYHPHWLVQWSHRCSHMRIAVHFPWLPGYIDANHPHYINNSWTFSIQNFYVCMCMHIYHI